MADLLRTRLVDIQSVTGLSTIGIYTAGVTGTPVGIASTSFVRSVVMHNTGLATCRVSVYVNPNDSGTYAAVGTGYGVTANRILRVDMASNETTFFETNYPIVLSTYDSISVDVIAPDAGGTGIGSGVNFIVNGDTFKAGT